MTSRQATGARGRRPEARGRTAAGRLASGRDDLQTPVGPSAASSSRLAMTDHTTEGGDGRAGLGRRNGALRETGSAPMGDTAGLHLSVNDSRQTPSTTTPSASPQSRESSLLAQSMAATAAASSRHRAGSVSSLTSSGRSVSKRRKPTMDQVIGSGSGSGSPMDGSSRQTSASATAPVIEKTIESHPFHVSDQLISQLQPSAYDLKVANEYSNEEAAEGSAARSVQAFAMIAGSNWTYFVKTLSVRIGRSSDNENGRERSDDIDIDLNPAKTVSRRHARIEYNSTSREWELELQGRNGLRLNGVPYKPPDRPLLTNGTIFEIGGEQFVFCLPATKSEGAGVKKTKRAEKAAVRRPYVASAPAPSHQVMRSSHVNDWGPVPPPQGIVGSGTEDSPLLINGVDYSPDAMAQHKPPVSYSAIISMAIRAKEGGRSTLSDIYDFVGKNFAYFRHVDKAGWQNSIRHNLSLSPAFTKVPREAWEPGKGMKWIITPGLEGKVDPKTIRISTPWFRLNLNGGESDRTRGESGEAADSVDGGMMRKDDLPHQSDREELYGWSNGLDSGTAVIIDPQIQDGTARHAS